MVNGEFVNGERGSLVGKSEFFYHRATHCIGGQAQFVAAGQCDQRFTGLWSRRSQRNHLAGLVQHPHLALTPITHTQHSISHRMSNRQRGSFSSVCPRS